jgi:3',5'-cyclic AMP phosphodiesterase CpdA
VEAAPDVVVVSGDLTQRARPRQFREAAAFLSCLPKPQVVVPGNHDVPLFDVPSRFLRPLARYRRYIGHDLEPVYVDRELAVVGVNSARSLTVKGGRINAEQVERACACFAAAGDDATHVLVTHHPFDVPRGHDTHARIGRAAMAMERLAEYGVDLCLAGHLHIGHVARMLHDGDASGALLVQAGTALSTRGRGEANSFNIIEIARDAVRVARHEWRPRIGSFEVGWSERFARSGTRWTAE